MFTFSGKMFDSFDAKPQLKCYRMFKDCGQIKQIITVTHPFSRNRKLIQPSNTANNDCRAPHNRNQTDT